MARQVFDDSLNPGTYAPDVQVRTTGASVRQQIVFTTFLAFAVSFIAKFEPYTRNRKGNKVFTREDTAKVLQLTFRGIVGWVVLLLILSAASDFETTQELATAFAWLILISAILFNGQDALNVLLRLVPDNSPGKVGT